MDSRITSMPGWKYLAISWQDDDDVAHVRVFGLAQRRGHADVDGVEFLHGREIGGGTELAGLHQRPEDGAGNVADVRIAGIDAPGFLLADVDSGDVESGLGELHRQGKTARIPARRCPRAPGANGSSLRELLRWRVVYQASRSSFSHAPVQKNSPSVINSATPVR